MGKRRAPADSLASVAVHDKSSFDLYDRFPMNQESKSRSSRSNSSDDLRINTYAPDFGGATGSYTKRTESVH